MKRAVAAWAFSVQAVDANNVAGDFVATRYAKQVKGTFTVKRWDQGGAEAFEMLRKQAMSAIAQGFSREELGDFRAMVMVYEDGNAGKSVTWANDFDADTVFIRENQGQVISQTDFRKELDIS